MRIFHYDRYGCYTHSTVARLDPEEARIAHRAGRIPERRLVPAQATTAPPPATGPGEVAVFEEGGWVVLEDHRGVAWATAGRADEWAAGDRVVWERPGALPPDLTEEPPPDRSFRWDGSRWVPQPESNPLQLRYSEVKATLFEKLLLGETGPEVDALRAEFADLRARLAGGAR